MTGYSWNKFFPQAFDNICNNPSPLLRCSQHWMQRDMVDEIIVLRENKHVLKPPQMVSKTVMNIADDLVPDNKRNEFMLLLGAAIADFDFVEEAMEIE